jgi:flagellar hook-associated protein 3 FlgL
MATVSIGDMAQVFLLRRYNTTTSRELGDLTADLARGTVADPGRHLGGQISPLAAIESALSRAAAHAAVADLGATRATAMQASLGRFNDAAASNAMALLRATQSAEPSGLSTVARAASAAFQDAIAALNTRSADKSLFAGTATDRAPLPDAAILLAAAKAALGPSGLPADAAAAIDAWLADPNGFQAQVYRGTTDTSPVALGPDESATLDVTAADPALRGTLKGLILGALMSDPDYAGHGHQIALARLAGESLIASVNDRTNLSARIGVAEERLSMAQSRHSAEQLVLQQGRSDLIAVDSYETVTRLQATEARLDMIYTLTSRLSRLSLADYL